MSPLFTALSLGRLQLQNRIVMAPMTRSRANPDTDCPTELMVEYYRQRASAGLIITEGIHPSASGKGYCRTPGLYSQVQADAWKTVVDAVHAEGGKIVAQLMHVGRVAHPDNKAADAETVAPSAIAAGLEMYTDTAGMQPMAMPRALTTAEIPAVIEEYRNATRLAYDAGFDGVELHCASGYLPAQFLSTGSNRRSDAYGGTLENRLRFPLEVLAAMAAVDGPDRVGFRICPGNPFNDLQDDDPAETFAAFLARASTLDLAYLHVIRMASTGIDNIALAQAHFDGPLIVNDSYNFEEASEAIAAGGCAAVSFGRYFIANPDLVARLKTGAALNRLNPATLYTPGPEGYTDYPPLD
jgi:N-ethylmaleimide reductase